MSADAAEYVRANDETRARLRALVDRLDRTQLTHSAMRGTQSPALDALDDLINDSALPAWNALPDVAARDVLASAEEGDAFVAALTPEITSRG